MKFQHNISSSSLYILKWRKFEGVVTRSPLFKITQATQKKISVFVHDEVPRFWDKRDEGKKLTRMPFLWCFLSLWLCISHVFSYYNVSQFRFNFHLFASFLIFFVIRIENQVY